MIWAESFTRFECAPSHVSSG